MCAVRRNLITKLWYRAIRNICVRYCIHSMSVQSLLTGRLLQKALGLLTLARLPANIFLGGRLLECTHSQADFSLGTERIQV